MLPPTTRFSNRVSDYVRYRPGYPKQLLTALERMVGLTCDWRVADVGSGTGKLSELFLAYGCHVTGVEPNAEMRDAAEQLLGRNPDFRSVDGTAEATGLGEGLYDLVTAGQAFHWFEPEATRVEFRRILSERGWVALIWNDRRVGGTPFLDAYEALLKSTEEYAQVGHKGEGPKKIETFFQKEPLTFSIPTSQEFGWSGLLGRALSSSYVPVEGQPGHKAFVEKLREIFDATQTDGKVALLYDTQMFVGRP